MWNAAFAIAAQVTLAEVASMTRGAPEAAQSAPAW
jgi:hypothetical protein